MGSLLTTSSLAEDLCGFETGDHWILTATSEKAGGEKVPSEDFEYLFLGPSKVETRKVLWAMAYERDYTCQKNILNIKDHQLSKIIERTETDMIWLVIDEDNKASYWYLSHTSP